MPRKLILSALTTLLLMAPVADAKVPAGPQKESGTVLFPTPHPQDPNTCFQGIGRRISMISQGTVSGPFGAIFDVDKATWGGKFKLSVTGGATAQEDVDLYLFKDFGGAPPEDPLYNSPTILATYQEREAGGEVGVIPAGSTKAIVCLFNGFAADFEYTAAPPKKKSKRR